MLLAAAILAFALVSGRAQRSIITLPMVFVVFGFLISGPGLGWVELPMDDELIHLLAEITLVVVLFTDASRIDLKLLRREHDLPVRLLSLGLPLTVLLGTFAGLLLLPGLGFWESALLAAILAPTDAALGQAVVSNKAVPVRIRQTLNVESGLNDGIVLPAVLVLLSVACATAQPETLGHWIKFASLQVTLGPLVGIAVGLGGGRLLDSSARRGWINDSFLRIGSLGLAVLAFAAAELVHGNGFIAAFAAGMAFGNTADTADRAHEFAEAEGQLLTLLVFLVFGGVLLPEALHHVTGKTVLYALASLTVVRMVPVALSLLGKDLRLATIGFVGWFGPRGIASILFALLVVEGTGPGQHQEVIGIAYLTVALSVLAHGVTAYPLALAYGKKERSAGAAEEMEVSEMPTRVSCDA